MLAKRCSALTFLVALSLLTGCCRWCDHWCGTSRSQQAYIPPQQAYIPAQQACVPVYCQPVVCCQAAPSGGAGQAGWSNPTPSAQCCPAR